MKNRLLQYLAVGAILLAPAIMVDRSYKDTYLLQQYADEIALYINEQANEAGAWVEGRRSWLERLSTMNPVERNATGLNERLDLTDKPYTLLLHSRDTILFWSNNKTIAGPIDLANIERQESGAVVHLPSGAYVCLNQPIGEMTATTLIPLRYKQTDPKTSPFAAGAHIPASVRLSEKQTPYAVRIGNRDLVWLYAQGSLQPLWVQLLRLAVYGLLAALTLVWLFRGASWLSKKAGAPAGLAAPAVATGLFWWADNQFNLLGAAFPGLPLFNSLFDDGLYIGRSLGAALAHIALLLCWMVFFHRTTRDVRYRQKSLNFRQGISTFGYLGAMLSVLFSVDLFRQLVLHTSIDFNFNNIVGLNAHSFAALGGIILTLAGFFLWSHRISTLIRDCEPAVSRRIMAQLVATALFAGVVFLYPTDLQINFLYLTGFALLYVLILETFVSWQESSFIWAIFWLLCFSGFAAFLINRYNYHKDRQTRAEYARALADNRDVEYAEPLLRAIKSRIQSDSQLPYLLKPWPFKPETAELEQYFNRFIFQEQYLFEHYRLQVFAFDGERRPLLREQTATWEEIVQGGWDAGSVIEDSPDIRYQLRGDGVFCYRLHFRVERMQDPTQPADIYLSLEHVFPQAARAYTRLFFKDPYKGLEKLPQYDFAVFCKDRLIVDRGQSSGPAGQTPVAKGAVREVISREPSRVDAIARSADGSTLAIVGREAGAWYRQLYLFAIIFTFASIFLFSLALLNTYLGFLPESFQFLLKSSGSLSRRIQYGTSAVLVPTFLLIGLMTYRHFTTSASNSQRADFNQRSEAVLDHLRTKFGGMEPGLDSAWVELPAALNPLLSSLNLDANLYAPNGTLVFSNQNALRQLGMVSHQIGAPVLEKLRSSTAPAYNATEPLGGLQMPIRYMPLRNERNQLLGYLGLPYLPERQLIGPEVSDFMGMLASLYVFLLLVAGVATLALARSIIRPIRLISDKIKELRFEDKNQPLDYQGDRSDELGELIEEYNRMVDKLEDSKTQLIRLEREGAWREMARQIAHDIKNPLTTMKLSMQQLERVSNDPMQAAAYLKKAITRLIEQIDSLAQIASEFSMFANLEIQHRHDLILNDVVENVHDLFTEQKEVELRLNLPEERIHISGDKSHLIRVFNNLVINAIQAIPEGRKGKISVLLYRKGDKAVVQIRDNGGGIPPDIQKRVFEPNFTTKSSGSGLGLAICRRIVEALDGAIRFETRQGEGTDFFVEMPITSVE
jgi:two-component system nitrogen regulation sensor histidine kinase NtrY